MQTPVSFPYFITEQHLPNREHVRHEYIHFISSASVVAPHMAPIRLHGEYNLNCAVILLQKFFGTVCPHNQSAAESDSS